MEGRAEWNAAMAASATVRVEPDETAPEVILVAGTCLRCEHAFGHAEPLVSYRAINRDDPLRPAIGALLRNAARRAAAANRSHDIFGSCSCPVPHPGSPEMVTGCGATWSLLVEWGITNVQPALELGMQELEAMEAPGFWTGFGTGVAVSTAAIASAGVYAASAAVVT